MSAPHPATALEKAPLVAESAPTPTHVRYQVLAVLCLAAVLAYIHRNCLAVPRASIERDLELTPAKMDQVLSAFYFGYFLFQIPGGWLADRYGTRRMLGLFALLWSVATGLTALADSFVAIIMLQALAGMAQAGIFPCCVKSFAKWFPPAERAFPSGLLASFMSVGGAIEKSLTAALLLYLTWQHVLLVYMLPGVAFAVWFFWWFRDQPENHGSVNEAEWTLIRGPNARRDSPAAERSPSVPWVTLLLSGRLALICAQQFFRAAAYIFYATLFPTFLQKTRHLSESESGFLSSFPLLGVVLGSLTGGILMDVILRRTGSRWASRKAIALIGTTCGGALLLLAFTADGLLLMMALITASMLFGGIAGPAAYTVTIDQGGPYVATVFSVMNTAGNIGAMLLPIALGAFVRATDWAYALPFVAALYFAAACCWAVLPVEGSVVPDGQPRT
jgi:MFS transporter, ACS family, D-galactonate transporter